MNNIKKYIIGLVIGLSCVIGISYASDTGYIGALFEKVGSDWKLLGSNIKDRTISQSKLDTNTSDKIDNIPTRVVDLIDSGSYALKTDYIPVNGNATKNGILHIGNSYTPDSRSKNMIEIGDSNYIRIGEWESDDMLSIYARKGVSINGIPLELKIKENASGWENVINSSKSGDGNKNFQLDSWTVPNGNKGVYAIRLSGRVDDGGLCGVYVNGKLAFGITHKTYFTKLKLDGDWAGNAEDRGAGNFSTTSFNIKDYSGKSDLGAQNHGNNTAYNVDSTVMFLKPGDTLQSFGWFNGGPGAESVNCKVDVEKGSLYY